MRWTALAVAATLMSGCTDRDMPPAPRLATPAPTPRPLRPVPQETTVTVKDGVPPVEGTGEAISQTLAVPAFTKVTVPSGGVVKILSGATERSLEVSAQPQIADRARAKVSNGQLTFDIRGSYHATRPVRFTLQTPSLARLTVPDGAIVDVEGISHRGFSLDAAGTGQVRLAGTANRLQVVATRGAQVDATGLSGAEVAVTASGSASVALGTVPVRLRITASSSSEVSGAVRVDTSADVTISGAATVRLSGELETLTLTARTGGSFDGSSLSVDAMTVRLSESAIARATVFGELNAEVTSGASLSYGGTPKGGKVRTSGAGAITRQR